MNKLKELDWKKLWNAPTYEEFEDYLKYLIIHQRQSILEEILGLESMKEEDVLELAKDVFTNDDFTKSQMEIDMDKVKETVNRGIRNQLRSQIKAEIKSLEKK